MVSLSHGGPANATMRATPAIAATSANPGSTERRTVVSVIHMTTLSGPRAGRTGLGLRKTLAKHGSCSARPSEPEVDPVDQSTRDLPTASLCAIVYINARTRAQLTSPLPPAGLTGDGGRRVRADSLRSSGGDEVTAFQLPRTFPASQWGRQVAFPTMEVPAVLRFERTP